MAITQDKTGKTFKITGTTSDSDVVIWPRTQPIWISKIVWSSVDASGDDLILLEGSGDELIREKAIAGDSTNDINYEYKDLNSPIQGLVVNTMDSGILYIHVK